MARTQKTILGQVRQLIEKAADAKQVKLAVSEMAEELERTHQIMRDDVVAVENKLAGGVSGWFDDGVNFRITVTNGVITAIDDSSGAGHG